MGRVWLSQSGEEMSGLASYSLLPEFQDAGLVNTNLDEWDVRVRGC
jgi:hypothetical protein